MVENDETPTSLAVKLEVLDADVEEWVAGRAVPTPDQCDRIAQLFEVPLARVLIAAGWNHPDC